MRFLGGVGHYLRVCKNVLTALCCTRSTDVLIRSLHQIPRQVWPAPCSVSRRSYSYISGHDEILCGSERWNADSNRGACDAASDSRIL